MITFQKHSSHLVAVLTAVALAGCVKSDQANQSADSTARNLTLAPTESTAAMKDVPAPPTEAAKPAPEKKTPPTGGQAPGSQTRGADDAHCCCGNPDVARCERLDLHPAGE